MNKLALTIIALSAGLAGCSSDGKSYDNNAYSSGNDNSSSATETSSSANSSSEAQESSSEGSSSSAPASLTGAEYYANLCSGCHGDDGNGDTPIGTSRTTEELTTYITNSMPKNKPEDCIGDCASLTAEFINGGFDRGEISLTIPTFKIAENPHTTSYKATGTMQVLAWQDGAATVMVVDEWRWLYTSVKDGVNESQCEDTCLAGWQPLLAPDAAQWDSPFGRFERSDNHWQVTLNGQPLYLKADGAQSAVTNDNWPLATSEPITTANDWLHANGHVWTLSGDAPAWQDLNNRTLYFKTSDGECSAGCLSNWPALLASDGAVATAPYSLLERSDTERKQWAYDGNALYLFASDQPGDTLSADITGWQQAGVIKAEATSSSASTASSSPSGSYGY